MSDNSSYLKKTTQVNIILSITLQYIFGLLTNKYHNYILTINMYTKTIK